MNVQLDKDGGVWGRPTKLTLNSPLVAESGAQLRQVPLLVHVQELHEECN